MPTPKKIIIVAGEESGDCHAAVMVKALLAQYPDWQFSGIGGKHMQEAGVELVSDLARFGVTGLAEVLRHAWVIKKAFRTIKAHLEKTKPDLLILVDYPGFNLRIARFAKQTLGIRTLYYISPQIWAWKANRIKTIKANIDHMAVILPFEKSLYQEAAVPVSFVGHPLTHHLPNYSNLEKLREELHLPLQPKLIALLPGSRRNEVEKHMPIMVKTIRKLSEQGAVHFVIPVAQTLSMEFIQTFLQPYHFSNVSIIQGEAVKAAACSDCVVVASGTASLECALLLKPMCIIYKTSFLTYLAAARILKVRYLGLCNLLTNKMIVPELIQYDCNVEELTKIIQKLLTCPATIDPMTANLTALKKALSAEQADVSIAELVEKTVLQSGT